jgi:succinate dehydrogenase / fumarate reductase flavoprotein subunit
MDANWRNKLLVCSSTPEGADATVTPKDQIPMREDLLELFELSELEKYFTDGELANYPEGAKK